MVSTSQYYEDNAQTFFDRYRSLDTAQVLGEFAVHVPVRPSLVLDVASGSGRDSEWLASLGHTVISVEPAKALRDIAVARGQDRRVVHFDSSLPHLAGLDGFAGGFDFVLCAAVWMHLTRDEQKIAINKIHSLMKAGVGAKAIVTFKVAPEDRERLMYALDPDQVVADFAAAGFCDVATVENVDLLGRDDTRWFTSVLTKA